MTDARLANGLKLSEVAQRAGWRKGKEAKLTDREVAELYDAKLCTVQKWRQRCGAIARRVGNVNSWSDADFEVARLTLLEMGRSIPALHGEYLRRLRAGRLKPQPSRKGRAR